MVFLGLDLAKGAVNGGAEQAAVHSEGLKGEAGVVGILEAVNHTGY